MVGEAFYRQIEAISDSLPAVESWDPPFSGDLDCLIKRDGSWHIDGAPLRNKRLLRLFSTVLKFQDHEYFLVTPVEKWRIKVEDLPFLVVELEVSNPHTAGQIIQIRSNVGDRVTIDAEHQIAASPIPGLDQEQAIPFVNIRANLMARFNRNTFLEIADLLVPGQNENNYSLISANTEFKLCL